MAFKNKHRKRFQSLRSRSRIPLNRCGISRLFHAFPVFNKHRLMKKRSIHVVCEHFEEGGNAAIGR